MDTLTIQSFLLKRIQRRQPLPETADLDSFDYIQSGHIDSMGLINFIVDIEAEFDIEILDTDIESSRFRTVTGLVSLIVDKLSLK